MDPLFQVTDSFKVVAAAGLGQYVEALVRKGGAEFNVRDFAILSGIISYTL